MTVCETGQESSRSVIGVHREAIVDSQSIKSAAMVSQSVGYDAGKHIKDASGF